jgi:hypothetical protein
MTFKSDKIPALIFALNLYSMGMGINIQSFPAGKTYNRYA